MELKETDLLQWCNKFTKGHDHITAANDLNKCWEDGTCFCALLYNWFPEKIPVHALLLKELREDKINNLRLAFVVGVDAGIPSTLDPEKMADSRENAKGIIQYLKIIHDTLSVKATKYQISQAWLKKYEEEEKARKLLELTQRNLLMGISQIKDKKQMRESANLGPGSLLAAKLGEMGTRENEFFVNEDVLLEKHEEDKLRTRARALIYESEPNEEVEIQKAREKARKKIRESLEEKEREKKREEEERLYQSEHKQDEDDKDQSIDYTITGKGITGGVVGKLCVFTVNITVGNKKPFDSNKNDLKCVLEGPSKKCHIMISGGQSGSFHVGFTPDQLGQHWVDFQYKGEWASTPYCLKIIGGPTNSCPTYPYTGKEKNSLGDTQEKENELDSGEKDENEKEKEREREKLLQKIQEIEKEIQYIVEINPSELDALRSQANDIVTQQAEASLISITYTIQNNNEPNDISMIDVMVNGEPGKLEESNGSLKAVQNVVENENEIDVKYNGSAITGFPIRFLQPKLPSSEERTEQVFQSLIEELKHKKEKDTEKLRKELALLIQKRREEDRTYQLEKKKAASNSQVYMWEKLSQENKNVPQPTQLSARSISVNNQAASNKLSLGPWEQKQKV